MPKLVLKTKREQREIEVGAGESILYAGLRAGLHLPYECCVGICGTCQAAPSSPDDLDPLWDHAPGNRSFPEGSGRVLMCQTTAIKATQLQLFGRLGDRDEGVIRPDYFAAEITTQQQLNADIIAFDLSLDRSCHFQAGQFVTLTVAGIAGWRAYSMTNYDPGSGVTKLCFIVKKLAGGGFSDWLFSANRIGASLKIFGPVGKACLRPQTDTDIIAITGGSGIAGVMSVLRGAIASGHLRQHKARLFFGVRTPQAVFFLDELATLMAQSNGNLEVKIAISDALMSEVKDFANLGITGLGIPSLDFTDLDFTGFDFAIGNVHDIAATSLGILAPNSVFFLAGPTPMVNAAIHRLGQQTGISDAQIRYDKFN